MILQCCYVEQSGANALLAPELAAGIKLREAPAVLLGCALRRSDVAALTDGPRRLRGDGGAASRKGHCRRRGRRVARGVRVARLQRQALGCGHRDGTRGTYLGVDYHGRLRPPRRAVLSRRFRM